jgi:HD superfamily phosphohydrolase YqeK
MVLLETELSPNELLRYCHEIEADNGRVRGERWGARTLDLDIVKFGDRVESSVDLELPHPEIPNRTFWQHEICELEQLMDLEAQSIEFPPWAQIHELRRTHVEGVAALLSEWGNEMGISVGERARWRKAVVLHDALKDAPESLFDELVPDWWNIPSLRHGPAAALFAERDGETDTGVLDAVRYHSVGYAGWQLVGKVLFLADYLEKGRDYHTERHSQFITRVPMELDATLRAVTVERLSGVLTYDFPLLPETVEFWNSLVGAR